MKREAYEAQFKLKAIGYVEDDGNRAPVQDQQIPGAFVL